MFPKKLENILNNRKSQGALRTMSAFDSALDFYSNDYLGLRTNAQLLEEIQKIPQDMGSGGSRLLSGTTSRMLEIENYLANYYQTESALLYPSGFMANLGLFSCLGTKGDTLIYDQYIHASVREGIRLSSAKNFGFRHNDYKDLEKKLKNATGDIYVIIEGVYSMHGDSPSQDAILDLQKQYGFYLIVDEAHSVGILGENGKGWTEDIPAEKILAKIITFGKAIGYHGAIIASSKELIEYLVNFSKSYIYTTAPPESQFEVLYTIHRFLDKEYPALRSSLQEVIDTYNQLMNEKGVNPIKIIENRNLEVVHQKLLKAGIPTKIIKHPTVEKGKEIIRLCLHANHTHSELQTLIEALQ